MMTVSEQQINKFLTTQTSRIASMLLVILFQGQRQEVSGLPARWMIWQLLISIKFTAMSSSFQVKVWCRRSLKIIFSLPLLAREQDPCSLPIPCLKLPSSSHFQWVGGRSWSISWWKWAKSLSLPLQVPRLGAHLRAEGVLPTMFCSHWFITLFAYTLPFDHLLRAWDIFFLEGIKVIFRCDIL